MPKRHHVEEVDEDDLELQSSQASPKRARTTDNSDEDEPPIRNNAHAKRGRAARTVNGNGKAREEDDPREDESDDEDVQHNQNGMNNIGDEEWERRYSDRVLHKVRNRRVGPGTVADTGIIEYVEMHQFMCHKYLRFNFGPQINFIIGHNGSGKSAVLSAITVALGGKSSSTGRGTGLKSFIREGQSVAEVTIHLKNQGEEAYRPEEYGKTIVITRRFTKEGSSTWKVKGKDGKVVSTKRDELSSICDHMNIQVDNPLTVLTQDSARQFLSASDPSDKYNFFMRGTQLQQLSEEYDQVFENIKQTSVILSHKKQVLPDLRARHREVKARYDEASKAREQKRKIDDLKKEMAWSHVAAKEAELDSKMQEAAKLSRRIPKIQENIDNGKQHFDEVSKAVTELEIEFNELESADHLIQKKNDIQEKMRANKNKLIDLTSDLRNMNQSHTNIKNQIELLEQQMQQETRRMASNTQAKREETQRRISEIKDNIHTMETRLSEIANEKTAKSHQTDALKRRGEELEKKKKDLSDIVNRATSMIADAGRSAKDAFVPYGKNIKGVLEKIHGSRWYGDIPLGPLGVHVKAKDPRTWGDLLRSQLGSLLTAFAITDGRDRNQLKRLLAEEGNQRTVIIIYEKDLFDFRHGEPREELLTVLRALEINNDYVLRILINQARIESRLLTHTRREAQQILQGIRGGGEAWTRDRMHVRVFPEGGVSSSTLNIRPMNGPLGLLLTGQDSAAQAAHFTNVKDNAKREYDEAHQLGLQLWDQFKKLKEEIDSLNRQEGDLTGQLRRAKGALNKAQQEANDDLPVGLAGLEAAKQEAEQELESIKEQFAPVQASKVAIDQDQRALQERLNEVKDMLHEYEERRAGIATRIEQAVELRLKAQNDIQYHKKKLEEEQNKVDATEDAVNILQEEFASWREKAAQYCAQVPNPRKVDDIKRHLDSVQKALKEREKTQGATVGELAQELAKAQHNLDIVEKEHKQMLVLNRALRSSLQARLHRWEDFRRHIALRCKHVFGYHLSRRGFFGNISFDHVKSQLNLRVQTEDQARVPGAAEKDPRSLSGGEKSFSTICLLLSLWDCIGCPLRCLDEFDVFMDAVNRRISMKMMIDTANSSDRKQYILITPQDMNNVTLGPTVRVLRMSDPERGNGTLPFTNGSA